LKRGLALEQIKEIAMTTKVFVLSMNCDNDAYHGEALAESVADNLVQIAEEVAQGSQRGHVRDFNGNIVGKYFFAESQNNT
jgi:RAB protein geranylgeranyltransferase component A